MATAKYECDIFTCPICLEKLKTPKSLPCSHTFCELCIGEFILSSERRTGHKLSSYPCPVCRSDVTPTNPEEEISQWASSLPPSLSILSQMDQSESTKQECHLCKTENNQNVATHWCRDCSDAFCDDCLRIHNRMKISADHTVVKIKEISKCAIGGEPDFCLISDKCSVHTSKILEAFCFDHQELCCLLCLTAQHKNCKNVQAFEEIMNFKTNEIESFEFELTEVKAKVEELVIEKKSKYVKLDSSFKDIELAANKSAASVKNRVDILLASFVKELHITREEQNTIFEGKLKTAENLLSHVVSLLNMTKSVREYGSLNHMFIHLKRSKPKLKSKINETNKSLNVESVDGAGFAINDTFRQVEKADSFGKIDSTFNVPIDLNDCMYMNSLDKISIKNITLRHKKTMSLELEVRAICIMDKIIFVGTDGKLNAINCDTGTCIAETAIHNVIKRLACDIETRTLFVSCFDSYIYTYNIQQSKFVLRQKVKSEGYTGGLCIFDGLMYVIVGNNLRKMKIDYQAKLQKCFNIRTNCCAKNNGLATDIKNKRLLYTSYNSEVVVTTTEGSEIFCYKDKHMKNVISVAVNDQGCIIACDLSGALHVISEDGKQSKTLLDNFDKIKELRDLCIDKSGKILYVCGNKFVEIYDILYN